MKLDRLGEGDWFFLWSTEHERELTYVLLPQAARGGLVRALRLNPPVIAGTSPEVSWYWAVAETLDVDLIPEAQRFIPKKKLNISEAAIAEAEFEIAAKHAKEDAPELGTTGDYRHLFPEVFKDQELAWTAILDRIKDIERTAVNAFLTGTRRDHVHHKIIAALDRGAHVRLVPSGEAVAGSNLFKFQVYELPEPTDEKTLKREYNQLVTMLAEMADRESAGSKTEVEVNAPHLSETQTIEVRCLRGKTFKQFRFEFTNWKLQDINFVPEVPS